MLCSLRPEGARRLMARFPLPRRIPTGTSRAWVQSDPYCSPWDRLPATTCGRGVESVRAVHKSSTTDPKLFVFSALCLELARFRRDPPVRPCVPHQRPEPPVRADGLPSTAAISCPPTWRLLFQFPPVAYSLCDDLLSGCPMCPVGPFARPLGSVDFPGGLTIAKSSARFVVP